MKLIYNRDYKLAMLYPVKMKIYKGKVVETTDKVLIQELKKIGFQEVKKKTKGKEGE